MRRIILFLLSFCFCVFADYSKGVCGASFLKIDPLARSASLGGAFSSISNDISALYYNPAGLGQLHIPEGVGGTCEWIEKTKLGLIGYCSPVSENASLGISVFYLKTDKIPLYKTKDSSSPEGEYDAEDLSIRIGYGVRWTRSNYFGITGGFLKQKIEKEKSSSFFFDIGEIYRPYNFNRFAFSIVLQNIGGKVKFIREEDELPSRLRIGFSYNILENAIIACDFVKPKDNKWQINGGIEWKISNILTLRGGYNSQVFEDVGMGISLGCGIFLNTFGISYTYVPYNDLGETHRLSFTTHFGKE